MSNLNNEIKNLLENNMSNYNVKEEIYFKSLLDGSMDKKTFLQTQEQFSYLVEYFSRPMALIIANIENELTRLKIVENLWEEHGNGDKNKIHGKTILQFIDNLGGNSSLLDNKKTDFIVRTFNTTLKGISAFEDYRVSTAFFAGIERAFVEVSECIVSAVIQHGWMDKNEITHYSLHKEIDIQHAEDFLKVVEDTWDDGETQLLVDQGIQQGMYIFLNVYTSFYHKYVEKSHV